MAQTEQPRLELGKLISHLDSAFSPHMHASQLDLKHKKIQDGFDWLATQVRGRAPFVESADVAQMVFAGLSLLRWEPDWKSSPECKSLAADVDRFFGKSFSPTVGDWEPLLLALDFLEQASPTLEKRLFRRHLDDAAGDLLETLRGLSEASDLHLLGVFARLRRDLYLDWHSVELVDDAVNSRDVYISAEAIVHICRSTNLLPISVVSRVEVLRPWIADLAPNPANFTSLCAILRAIALSDGMAAVPVSSGSKIENGEEQRGSSERSQQAMELKLTELLSYGQRADGSWFGSMWQTAWLLQAASYVHAFRTLEIPSADVSRALGEVGDLLLAHEREVIVKGREVRTRIVPQLVGYYTVLLLIIATFVWALVTFGWSVFLGIVGAVGVGVVGFLLRQIRSLWRRTQIFH